MLPQDIVEYIIDEFHNVVNNIKNVLENVNDKKKFYNNLLELQNYLIHGGHYDREPLIKEMMNIDEQIPEEPPEVRIEPVSIPSSEWWPYRKRELATIISGYLGIQRTVSLEMLRLFINIGTMLGHDCKFIFSWRFI